jgi:hypothetical protein
MTRRSVEPFRWVEAAAHRRQRRIVRIHPPQAWSWYLARWDSGTQNMSVLRAIKRFCGRTTHDPALLDNLDKWIRSV